MLKNTVKVIVEGRSSVDDVELARFLVSIDNNDPTNMVFSARPIDPEAYRANIEIVRADEAEFRAKAYAIQDEFLKSTTK